MAVNVWSTNFSQKAMNSPRCTVEHAQFRGSDYLEGHLRSPRHPERVTSINHQPHIKQALLSLEIYATRMSLSKKQFPRKLKEPSQLKRIVYLSLLWTKGCGNKDRTWGKVPTPVLYEQFSFKLGGVCDKNQS